MNFSKIFNWFFTAGIILFLIIPFLLPVFHTIPVSDDICRASLDWGDFFYQFSQWYFFHNGRFINALFSIIPVYDLTAYRWILAFNFCLLLFTIFRFFEILLKIYSIKIKREKIFLVASVCCVSIIAELPSVFEFFYWYAANTAYLLSFIVFSFFLLYVLRIVYGFQWNLFLGIFMIIFLNGNNELFLAFTNLTLLFLFLFKSLKDRNVSYRILILNFASWISSIIVILAPGTILRRETLGYEGDIFVSIKVAIIYGARFIMENLIEFPNILFISALFLFVLNSKPDFKKAINPIKFILVSYVLIISFYGLKFYGTGLVERNVGRVGNILHLVVFLFFILNTVNLAVYLSRFWNLNTNKIAYILLFGFIVSIIFWNSNYRNLIIDYRNNSFNKFDLATQNRYKLFSKTIGDTLTIKEIESPLTLKSGDWILQNQEWAEPCLIRYVNKRYNKSFKHVEMIKKD